MSYGTMTCPFCNATVLSNTIQRYFSYHGTSEEPSLNDACELLVSGTFCPNCRRKLSLPQNTPALKCLKILLFQFIHYHQHGNFLIIYQNLYAKITKKHIPYFH